MSTTCGDTPVSLAYKVPGFTKLKLVMQISVQCVFEMAIPLATIYLLLFLEFSNV